MTRTKNRNVLILTLSGIGNLLMQSPAIELLKQARPDWRITAWVAPRGTKAIAKANPNIDEVLEAPIQQSPIGHIKTIYTLAQKKFDTGIVFSPGQLVKSAAYLYLIGTDKRIGHTYPFRGREHSGFLLTDTIDEDDSLHDIEQNIRLLGLLDVPAPKKPLTYRVHIPKDHKQEAQIVINKLNTHDKPLIGIHAGSAPDLTFKRWPIDRFANVASRLRDKYNAHILIFGGPDEEEQKQQLKNAIGDNATPVSASLLTTAAILNKCTCVISNDSGLMHLASATDTPVVGLFGPTDETKTGPRGKNAVVVRAPNTKPAYDTEQNFHLGTSPHDSILAITPDMVIEKVRQHVFTA